MSTRWTQGNIQMIICSTRLYPFKFLIYIIGTTFVDITIRELACVALLQVLDREEDTPALDPRNHVNWPYKLSNYKEGLQSSSPIESSTSVSLPSSSMCCSVCLTSQRTPRPQLLQIEPRTYTAENIYLYVFFSFQMFQIATGLIMCISQWLWDLISLNGAQLKTWWACVLQKLADIPCNCAWIINNEVGGFHV